MYGKVLIPLDGSGEPEQVVSLIEPELEPDGEAVLITITSRRPVKQSGRRVSLGGQQEDADRAEAMAYLKGVVDRRTSGRGKWTYAVLASDSAAEAIADKARREGVDLIAMYTHDRKGLARLIKGNVAREVKRLAAMEVRTFTDSDLAAHSAEGTETAVAPPA